MNNFRSIAIIAALGFAMPAGAEEDVGNSAVVDELELEGTTITGNQELPKGLYVIPWQDEEPEEIVLPPVRLFSDRLEAVDPTILSRRLKLYDAQQSAAR